MSLKTIIPLLYKNFQLYLYHPPIMMKILLTILKSFLIHHSCLEANSFPYIMPMQSIFLILTLSYLTAVTDFFLILVFLLVKRDLMLTLQNLLLSKLATIKISCCFILVQTLEKEVQSL